MLDLINPAVVYPYTLSTLHIYFCTYHQAESEFLDKIKLDKSTSSSLFKIFMQSLETCMCKMITESDNTIIFVSIMVLHFLSQRQQKSIALLVALLWVFPIILTID